MPNHNQRQHQALRRLTEGENAPWHRIVLTAFGSAGDLNPFVALGLALRERGHTVILPCRRVLRQPSGNWDSAVETLSGDVVAALATHTQRLLGGSNPVTSLDVLVRYGIMPTLAVQVEELRERLSGCRPSGCLFRTIRRFVCR